jgi:hypothetical protein
MNIQQLIDQTVESLLYVEGMNGIAEIIRSGNFELKRTYASLAASRIERTISYPNSLIVIEAERKALNNCKILAGTL